MKTPSLKNLPFDITNEKNLISCLLQKPELLREEIFSFSIDDFHFPPHQRIVQAMIDMDNEGVTPDPGMVRNSLKDPQEQAYLDDLVEFPLAFPSNARHYAEKLREIRDQRKAIIDADKLIRAANSGVPEDITRVRSEIATIDEEEADSFLLNPSEWTTPPSEREEIVEGFIPRGIATVLFGPPATGKSILLKGLAVAVASGGKWFTQKVSQGPVVYASCEWPDQEEVKRIFFHEARTTKDQLYLYPTGPIWAWVDEQKGSLREKKWVLTPQGRKFTRDIEKIKPSMVIIDTIIGLAKGTELLNLPQQYELGQTLQGWASRLNTAVVAVAHTNQASSKDSAWSRLGYESMAGTNGLPGSVRWMIGITKMTLDELDKGNFDKDYVCVAVSKANVHGINPSWERDNPGLFAWNGRSQLEYAGRQLELKKNQDDGSSKDVKKENGKKGNLRLAYPAWKGTNKNSAGGHYEED